MLTRRSLIQSLASLPLFGGLFSGGLLAKSELVAHAQSSNRDYFKELGLRTFINAAGTYTALTGSMLPDEVVKAMEYASREYVKLDDIQDKVGERIATLLKCEAATVTAGAASALTLGTAGVLSGMDEAKVVQIPDLAGMKSEVIVQRSHHIGYLHAVRNCGVKIVYVETRKELEDAFNEKTALLLFINAHNNDGRIRAEEFVKIGKMLGIPTFNDCAADVPPVENLWKFTQMGFDLVTFSGGKGLRGPQSAGLLLGRKNLIAAARLHAPPRGDTIGRGMKVNKEEVLGMLAALELYLGQDHAEEWKLWESQIQLISDQVRAVAGVETRIHVPEIANHVPSLDISWNRDRVKITPAAVRDALRNGHPSIETVGGNDSVGITTWMMRPGEERVVARRLREILEQASS